MVFADIFAFHFCYSIYIWKKVTIYHMDDSWANWRILSKRSYQNVLQRLDLNYFLKILISLISSNSINSSIANFTIIIIRLYFNPCIWPKTVLRTFSIQFRKLPFFIGILNIYLTPSRRNDSDMVVSKKSIPSEFQ